MSWRDKLNMYLTDVKHADLINWDWVQWTYLNLDDDAHWKKHMMLDYDLMWLWEQIERLTSNIISRWMKN